MEGGICEDRATRQGSREGGEEGIRIMLSELWRDINVGPLLILSSRLNSVVRPCHAIVRCIAGKDALSTLFLISVSARANLLQMQHRERRRRGGIEARNLYSLVIFKALGHTPPRFIYHSWFVSRRKRVNRWFIVESGNERTNPCDWVKWLYARNFPTISQISESGECVRLASTHLISIYFPSAHIAKKGLLYSLITYIYPFLISIYLVLPI